MPTNSHISPELKHNKLNTENLGIDSTQPAEDLTILMRNSNEIRPHRDPEGRAGLRARNPHTLFHKNLTKPTFELRENWDKSKPLFSHPRFWENFDNG